MKLTEKQKEMAIRLSEEGRMWWSHCSPQEVRTLNELVKKEYATKVGEWSNMWFPTNRSHDLRMGRNCG